LSRRDLEQVAVERDAVLANEQHVLAVVVDGHDRDRSRMPNDMTVELLTVRPGDAHVLEREISGLGARRRTDDAENRHERTGGTRSRSGVKVSIGSRGALPSARSAAARTNAANNGCGRSGRLLNSGCAWVAAKNGCRSRRSSTNSTRRSSGDVPEHTRPASSSRARYLLLTSKR